MRNAWAVLLAIAASAACKQKEADELATPPPSPLEKLPRAEVIADKIQNPIGIAVDGKYVYWGDGGALRRAPKLGGAPADVCRVEAVRIESIAVGPEAIYFGAMGAGVFRRRNQDGAPCERIATGSNPTSLAISGDQLHYWNGTALKVALEAPGTAPAPDMWQAGYTGALLVDADSIYVHQGSEIARESKAAAGRAVLGRTGHLGVAMAIDDTHLYWGDDLIDGVLRAPKDGGPLEWVTPVWSIGATLALDGDWIYVVDIDANVHAISKRDGRSAQISTGDFTGMGTNNVSVAVDVDHFFIGDDTSVNKVPGITHVDLTQPGGELPEVEWQGAVARVAKRLDGIEFTPRPAAVEASTVYFSAGSDQAQDWANATLFTRWRDARLTDAVKAGTLPVVLVAGVSDRDEPRARRRAEAVAQKIRDEVGAKAVFEIQTRVGDSPNVVVQFAPAAYAAVWAP